MAAYLMRNLDDPDGQLARFGRCCGRAGHWRSTSTPSVTRDLPQRCGMPCVGRSSFRWRGGAAGYHPVPASVEQCQRLRRSVGIPKQVGGGGFLRYPRRDDERLATGRRAHLSRDGAAMSEQPRGASARGRQWGASVKTPHLSRWSRRNRHRRDDPHRRRGPVVDPAASLPTPR